VQLALEVCESSKQAKGEKFIWVVTTILDSQVLGHEQQVEIKKERWELGHPWKAKFGACWSVFRVLLELKIEELGCQA
jgi:hypothetical protein